MSDMQRMALATAIRNAATHQCIFTVWDGFEMAFVDGALHRVTPNASQFQRGYAPIPLRVEELFVMSDDDIWARVMGDVS
jgi:hypothetical protein